MGLFRVIYGFIMGGFITFILMTTPFANQNYINISAKEREISNMSGILFKISNTTKKNLNYMLIEVRGSRKDIKHKFIIEGFLAAGESATSTYKYNRGLYSIKWFNTERTINRRFYIKVLGGVHTVHITFRSFTLWYEV